LLPLPNESVITICTNPTFPTQLIYPDN
jgi:hypothetical protein